MTEPADWDWLRDELTEALDAYVAQLDGLSGSEPVPGLDWTVADLTAHLASIPGLHRRLDEIGQGFEMPDDFARFSDEQRSHIRTDDLGAAVELMRSEMAHFVDAIDDPDAARWMYGCRTTHRNAVGAFLVELTIHGQDLGRLTGTKSVLTSERAAAGIPNTMAIVPTFVDRTKTAELAGSYHLRFRGVGDWHWQIDHDGAFTSTPGRPRRADARLSADPAAFLLVSLGRVNRFRPAMTGKMVAYGRRPWRLMALGEITVAGV